MTVHDQMQLDRDWMRSRYHRIQMEVVTAEDLVRIYLDGELFGWVPGDLIGTETELTVNWHEWRWVLIKDRETLGRVAGEQRVSAEV